MKGTLLRATLSIFGALIAPAIVNPAAADVTATRMSGNGSATETESNGRWKIEIFIPTDGTTVDHVWLIEADEADVIDEILVEACELIDPIRPVYLIIQPSGFGSIIELGDVRFFSTDCSVPAAAIVIQEMYIAGDVTGELDVIGIGEAFIERDLIGTIDIPLQTAGYTPSIEGIEFLEIHGDGLHNYEFQRRIRSHPNSGLGVQGERDDPLDRRPRTWPAVRSVVLRG